MTAAIGAETAGTTGSLIVVTTDDATANLTALLRPFLGADSTTGTAGDGADVLVGVVVVEWLLIRTGRRSTVSANGGGARMVSGTSVDVMASTMGVRVEVVAVPERCVGRLDGMAGAGLKAKVKGADAV